MKYVILGDSTAGIAAVEGIRSVDKAGEITIVSEEAYAAYGRPLISYYLAGATDLERMRSRPADFYQRNGVQVRRQIRAERIDAEQRIVRLGDGSALQYDRLLVATGSRPFTPPMRGMEGVYPCFHFLRLDDALALEKALSPTKKVLIVGAGLIGLKCFEGIAARVQSVAIVDMADRVLPSVLDERGGRLVGKQLQERGAQLYLADSVAEFRGNTAILQSGRCIDFDILVVAVGVRPNAELVQEAGGEVARGIVTDDRQQTSLPDIYAAGDCCESYDVSCGKRRVLALLPNAYRQGFCAGVNMAGGCAHFDRAIPLNAVGLFGTSILTAGSYIGEGYTEEGVNSYKKLFVQAGVLKGFILINRPERAGIYTSLVQEETLLSEEELQRLRRDPTLLVFSALARKKKLAQEV